METFAIEVVEVVVEVETFAIEVVEVVVVAKQKPQRRWCQWWLWRWLWKSE